MNKKDSLAILALLITGSSQSFYEGTEIHTKESVPTFIDALKVNCYLADKVLCFLSKLKLKYEFVKDILNDDYGSDFYHQEWGYNSVLLPKHYKKEELVSSEHDSQIWITDEGRIGVWCEIDGFVAWLDEYETVWTVDTREEVAERERKHKEWFDKVWKPKIQKAFDKAFENIPEEAKLWYKGTSDELIDFYLENNDKVAIKKFEVDGLGFYEVGKGKAKL